VSAVTPATPATPVPAVRLRNVLLRWLLLPSLALWAATFTAGNARRLTQAHDAYDRTLRGAALVLAEQLRPADGQIALYLPYAALEMLRTDAQDRIFYRAAALSGPPFVTGYDDLPPPAALPVADQVVFYDVDYRGEQVRVAALVQKVLDGHTQWPVLVQVAETIEARRQMSRRIMADAAAVQLGLIAIAALLMAYGVHRGLAPLKRLRRLVALRAAHDLTPIDEGAVPREVAPLIEAINQHTDRQRRLVRAQRRFIASASHQLKTPLTVLRAQAAHAARLTDPAQLQAVVEQLHDTTRTTSRLVEQLLTLARSDPGQARDVEALDLTELARDVTFNLLTLAREKGIDLGFQGEQAVPVRGERVLLREMVANLVHNAIVYTPPQGQVTVWVTLSAQGQQPGRPLLCVDDNGPGIAPAERGRVLEPFYRVPGSAAEGSGLGLAIVHEICQREGLSLSLEDGPQGSGLRVQVQWPPGA
jgi:two-component system sensor histidine kinase TctE